MRTLEIDDNNICYIKNEYEPVLIEYIKSIPGRRWIDKNRGWKVLVNSNTIPYLLELINNKGFCCEDEIYLHQLAESFNYNQTLSSSTEGITKINIPDTLNGTLRPYQLAGIEYAINVANGNVLIADGAGVGKTMQGIGYLEIAKDCYPAIVVCLANSKTNWYKQVRKWLPLRTVGILPEDTGNYDITIINYDQLDKHLDVLRNINANCIVIDESHYLKNRQSARCKNILRLVHNRGDRDRTSKKVKYLPYWEGYRGIPQTVLLTGTPIKKSPIDLSSQLDIIGKLDQFGGESGYARRYCNGHMGRFGYDVSGSSNEAELHNMLKSSCMVRREIADVLTDIEPINRLEYYIDISNRQEYREAENKLATYLAGCAIRKKEFVKSISHLSKEEKEIATTNYYREKKNKAERVEKLLLVNTLKHVTARGKIQSVIDWIDNHDEKLMVYCWHVDVIEALANHYKAPIINGSVPLTKRDKIKEDFISNSDTKLLFLNIQSGGTALDGFQDCCNNMLLVEYPWTPDELEQVEARLRRSGQEKRVNVHYMIGSDTVDEYVLEVLSTRKQVNDKVLNGNTGQKIGDTIDEICNKVVDKYR